jgi:hypothetical protein
MKPSHLLIVLAIAVSPLTSTTTLARSSKPSFIRVTSAPLPLKQNEEGSLNVQIVALVPLEQVEIVVSADTGVELVKAVPPLTLGDLKAGERRDVVIPVRLTAAEFGYVLVSGTATMTAATKPFNHSVVVGTIPPAPPRVRVGTADDLPDLTLLKVSAKTAIVRFGRKEMLIVRVGDRLGRNGAEILEIGAGRMVLDETFIGTDGKPNRARVTLEEGETGGTRVLRRHEELPPPAGRQRIVQPPQKKSGR